MKLSPTIGKLKKAQQAALASAVTGSGEHAKSVLVNAIYDRYAFKMRDYISQRLALSVDHRFAELRVSARHRITNAINFVEEPVYRQSKNPRTPSKMVLDGYMGAFLRGKTSHWGGAFTFVGKNNNLLLAYREKGDLSREIPDVSYGPSVAGALVNVREQAYPQVMKHIQKHYQREL
tara:strand:- start:17207 stop:17737 length:531 start_codon:yes stop_codon:yes gene_type:complete